VAKESGNEVLSINGREVQITNPEKLYFSSQVKVTKLELVQYYLSVAPGALKGIQDRPIVLKRFVNGAEAEAFYQKRAPEKRPAWLRTVTLSFPSGRTAEEVVVDDAAGLAWIVNLGCIELHPHPVRSSDLDHPDELRIDLDPIPGVSWDDVRRVALEVQGFLDEMGLRGWPKTSGSRGMHVNVRIKPRWTFTQVRRAAVALSRAVERRAPTLAKGWCKTSFCKLGLRNPVISARNLLAGAELSRRHDRHLAKARSVPVARGYPDRVDQDCPQSTQSRGPQMRDVQFEPDYIPCL
jgi:DNA ligase D-like protein (predicted polymerase)